MFEWIVQGAWRTGINDSVDLIPEVIKISAICSWQHYKNWFESQNSKVVTCVFANFIRLVHTWENLVLAKSGFI